MVFVQRPALCESLVAYVPIFADVQYKFAVFTAVCAVVHVGVHRKDFVDVFGVAENFLVVVTASREGSLLGPAFAFIA
jgi:hypothetical protein